MHCVLASPLEVPRVGGSSERESQKSCLCNHLPELCEQPRLENRACSFGPRTIGWYTYTGETTNSERNTIQDEILDSGHDSGRPEGGRTRDPSHSGIRHPRPYNAHDAGGLVRHYRST